MQDESSNTNDDAQGNSSLIIPPELSVRPDKSGVAGVAGVALFSLFYSS